MRRFSIFLALIVLLNSCKKGGLRDCFKSTGDTTTEFRNLESFTEIELLDNVDVYLIPDSHYSAKVEAGENLIGEIKTEVANGVLTISNENSCNWVRSLKNEFKVYVYLPYFKQLTCRGSGDVIGQGGHTTDTLNIDLWEAYTSVYLDVNANQVFVRNHTGPGDVILRGIADYCYTYTTGNGFIFCDEFTTRESWAFNTGTGDIYVNAKDTLRAEINYIGNVFYTGNPSNIKLEDNGDGELIPLD